MLCFAPKENKDVLKIASLLTPLPYVFVPGSIFFYESKAVKLQHIDRRRDGIMLKSS